MERETKNQDHPLSTAGPSRAEGEVDRLVHDQFFADPGPKRVCIEVGAARPDYLSIGGYFRVQGWRVISIEPNPEFCAAHRRLGNEVYEYACGEADRDDVEFFVVDSHGSDYEGGKVSYESFSSLGIRGDYAALAKSVAIDVNSILVKVRRLDTILKEHAPDVGAVDLLVVDVEGWELEVLRGLAFAKHRPRVLIVENLFNDATYHGYMAGQGYRLWRTIPPNDIYVIDRRSWLRRWLRKWFR